MTPARLVGTDLVHAMILASCAGLGHARNGNVAYATLGLLLAGSLPGVAAGVALTRRMPQGVLRLVLGAVVGATGLRLLLA